MTTSPGQSGERLRKWAVTIAAVLALAGLGSTAALWIPWLLEFAHTKKETVESLKSLLEFGALLVGWASAVIIFFVRLWREKKEPAPAGGQVVRQTGGVNVASQHDVIVSGDVVQNKTEIHQAPLAFLPSLHQLPPLPADFTGRKDELREFLAAIAASGVAFSGLQGQGGVGKTALALKLAAELTPRYPDGQIYLDLKGVSETPVPPSEALAHVIRSFHPEVKPPEGQTELEALYRTVLHGKRTLLLMDNARDRAQVAPLLPPQGCAFLVTSRRHFTLPGLFVKDLNTLPPADAEALLLAITPRIDGRAQAISRLCGFLPHALRLAAGALAKRKDLSPADYVRQLEGEKNRLRLLRDSGKSEASDDQSVEASIGLSYALLDRQTQKYWRTVGVFPDTFDLPAAAAAWETEAGSAQSFLGALLEYSMLEWNETSARYRLHDLMRDFARARLDSAELDGAARRHAAHYLQVLGDADALYEQGGDALKRSLVLFDAEWGNIQAGQAWAASHATISVEAAQLCSKYPNQGAFLLGLRQHPREQIRWREPALSAARQLKDRGTEGAHLGNLGLAYRSLGENRRAIEYHEKHLSIAREIGDRKGEGQALGNLGVAYRSLNEYPRAIEYYEKDLYIAREIGDRKGEGSTLGNLGNAHYSLGEYSRAIEYHEKHLAIAREVGDRKGEGQALGNLGSAYHCLGEHRRAISYYEKCLAIAREVGDRFVEGNALWNTSLVFEKLGKRQIAIEHAGTALQILEQIESPLAERVREKLQQWEGHTGDANA